jgi:hypothetical protein
MSRFSYRRNQVRKRFSLRPVSIVVGMNNARIQFGRSRWIFNYLKNSGALLHTVVFIFRKRHKLALRITRGRRGQRIHSAAQAEALRAASGMNPLWFV